MNSKIRQLIKKTPARYLYHRLKAMVGGKSQSDEGRILRDLAKECPKTFVEFGFHPTQYNCITLNDFSGLLIDGDAGTIKLARSILPARIAVKHDFLTLETLDSIAHFFPQLGVLSIDVDGNDYWFLEYLLPARPHVIAVEYNASFGISSITVPYDSEFERHAKHPTGWYHGASLSALTSLCARHSMKLVAVAAAGANAFFVRDEVSLPKLDPVAAYAENSLRNQWSNTSAAEQWQQIKDLPYVKV